MLPMFICGAASSLFFMNWDFGGGVINCLLPQFPCFSHREKNNLMYTTICYFVRIWHVSTAFVVGSALLISAMD